MHKVSKEYPPNKNYLHVNQVVHDNTKVNQIFDVMTQQNKAKNMNTFISNFYKISFYTLKSSPISFLSDHPKYNK